MSLSPQDARSALRGAVIPLVTIFSQDGSLDLPATAAHAEWIIERGARHGNAVFLVAGSGGDFTSMDLDERKRVIRTVAETVAGRVPIIAGAQSLDIRECIALCQFCEEIGIGSAQVSGPYYYDGRPGDVVAWFEKVRRRSRIGVTLYNNWYTGYDMPLDLVERLVDMGNVVAVKWSSPDVHTYYRGIRRLLPRVAVIDNSLLPIEPHMMGCRAYVSHVPNFYPEHSWRVWELLEQGRYFDAAQTYNEFMVPYFDLVAEIERATAGEGVYVRAAMEAAGLPVGTSRLPSRDEAVTPEIREAFRRLMHQRATDATSSSVLSGSAVK